MQKNNKKSVRYISGAILIIAVSLLVLYSLGFRLQGTNILSPASVEIKNVNEGTRVFIDSRERAVANKSGDLNLKITPGSHSIIISKDDHWPYLKEIFAESGEKYTISPFTISRNPSGLIIPAGDAEYSSIMELFKNRELPQKETPLVSINLNTAVWVEDGVITVKWLGNQADIPDYFCTFDKCENTLKSFDPITDLRSVSFYGERDDVLLVAIQNGIFVLEINPFGTQNFQPLYEGKEPAFRLKDTENIYILDNNILMLIPLK